MAVDLLGERAARDRGGDPVLALHAPREPRRSTARRRRGLARDRAARRRARRAPDPPRARQPARLARERLHPRAVPRVARVVRRPRAADAASDRRSPRLPPPDARDRLHLRRRDGDRALRPHLPVSAPHPADPPVDLVAVAGRRAAELGRDGARDAARGAPALEGRRRADLRRGPRRLPAHALGHEPVDRAVRLLGSLLAAGRTRGRAAALARSRGAGAGGYAPGR